MKGAVGALLLVALRPVSSMTTTKQPSWDVARYQGQHSFVWEYGASLLDLVDLKPGERLLDVGCGSGERTQALAERQPLAHCFGLDADPAMIRTAKEQYSSSGLLVSFYQGDVRCDIPMEDGPYDVVFSNAALHWVPQAEQAVASISQALKPGGRLIVEFGGKGNVDKIVTATNRALQLDPPHNPWYFPSIAQYTTLLEKHGIEVTSAALFDRPTPLEQGDQGLRNWILMFGNAFFQDMPQERKEQLLAAIEDDLRSDLFDGTKWVADYRRIRIVGKKLA